MNNKEIIKQHLSLCYKCIHSRNVAEKLLEEGYTGCIIKSASESGLAKFHHIRFNPSNIKAKDMGLGWIQKTGVFQKQTETMINDALIVKECTSCSYFEKE